MDKPNIPNINEEIVKEIIKKEFNWLSLKEIFQYPAGWVHKKYRVSFLDSHKDVVIRFGAEKENVHFNDDYTLDKEIYVTNLISQKTNVKVAKILSRGQHRDLDYLIMEDLNGPCLEQAAKEYSNDYNDKTLLKIINEWGAAMAQIHNSLKSSEFGYIDGNGITKTFNSWSTMFEDYINLKLESELIPRELREASRSYIRENISVLNLEKDPTLVLYDINGMNVIVRNGGLGGLIDFECALYGHKSLDFMFPFLDRNVGNIKTKEPFTEGYLAGGGILPNNLGLLNKLNTLNFLMSTIINYHGATGHRVTWSIEYTQKLEQFLKENA